MKKSLSKILCCVLALVLVLGMATISSFAANENLTVTVDFSNADGTTSDYDNPGSFPAYYYDGTPKSPIITIYDGDKKLEEGVDYILEYILWNREGAPTSNEVPVGIWWGGEVFNRYEVVAYGRGDYSDTIPFPSRAFFYITRAPQYSIYFYKNDGSDEYVAITNIDHGSYLDPAEIPVFERQNYDFGGWYTDSACTEGNEFDVTQPIKNPPMQLYAKWISNLPPVQPEPITSVTITLPELVEGDGYVLDSGGYGRPHPVVTIPEDALYEIIYSLYAVEDDSTELGYGLPKADATFKKGDEVYIATELLPTDLELHPFLDETIGADHKIAIKVNGGELVKSYLYTYYENGDPDLVAGRSLIILSKVVVGGDDEEPGDEPSPSTGDMTMTWIVAASAMLLLAAVLMGTDSKKKRTH